MDELRFERINDERIYLFLDWGLETRQVTVSVAPIFLPAERKVLTIGENQYRSFLNQNKGIELEVRKPVIISVEREGAAKEERFSKIEVFDIPYDIKYSISEMATRGLFSKTKKVTLNLEACPGLKDGMIYYWISQGKSWSRENAGIEYLPLKENTPLAYNEIILKKEEYLHIALNQEAELTRYFRLKKTR